MFPIAAVLLLLVLLGLADGARVPLGAIRPRALILLGDSLAVGLRPHLAALARRDGVAFGADVRGGTSSWQWGGWATRLLEAQRPTLALICLGTNDAAGPRRGEFGRHAAALTVLCRNHGARAVWLLPPPMPWSMATVREGVTAAVQLGAARIDAPPGLARAPDHIHLTGDGYATWARVIWASLP